MSSSITASLTDSRFSAVVDSAMITGLNAVDLLVVFVLRRRDDVARRVDRGRRPARVPLLRPLA